MSATEDSCAFDSIQRGIDLLTFSLEGTLQRSAFTSLAPPKIWVVFVRYFPYSIVFPDGFSLRFLLDFSDFTTQGYYTLLSKFACSPLIKDIFYILLFLSLICLKKSTK